jgi:hypothetical protein
VRKAPERTLILADGFSCRSQIRAGSPREGLHLAEVLAMAVREGQAGPRSGAPERSVPAVPAAPSD